MDINHPPDGRQPSNQIVECFLCGHDLIYRGNRFCSTHCRGAYDAGFSRPGAKLPLAAWRVVAGPPGTAIGAPYCAPCSHQQKAVSATNARRATRRDSPVTCATCGKTVERRMRAQIYCSSRCRDRGRQRVRKALLGPDTRAPASRHKKPRAINGLRTEETRPSIGISGPAERAS
jgi:predicted nucleic acid-binding Zn ribbon protein